MGVVDILSLLRLAEGYGISEWLQFDASVVRGLAYYTGVVFEGFDRRGQLRAICGGGRYDKLLQSMTAGAGAAEGVPAVGFGFGDAVIVELLKDKGLLPDMQRGKGGEHDVQVGQLLDLHVITACFIDWPVQCSGFGFCNER